MTRLYRWLCRKAWTAGFDAGAEAERMAMLRFHHATQDRPQWYFVPMERAFGMQAIGDRNIQ